MRSAAVSQLKASLSEYLSLVKGGEEVLVTERGKPIARVVPIEPESSQDARRMDLGRRGIMRLGRGRIAEDLIKDLPAVDIPPETIARIMEDEREENR